MVINLREYQRQVRSSLLVKKEIDQLSHCALGLTGEAGEVADLVKKSGYVGRSLNTELVVEELGDTLWYLTWIAGEMFVDLEELAMSNIVKLEKRHPAYYNSNLLGLVPR